MDQSKKRYRFTKAERISSAKKIDYLFKTGKWEHYKNIRFVYKIRSCEEPTLPKVLISSPKKNYRKAVERNRIKRHIREAYRLNKTTMVETAKVKNSEILMAFLYSGNVESSYAEIEKDIRDIMKNLIRKLN